MRKAFNLERNNGCVELRKLWRGSIIEVSILFGDNFFVFFQHFHKNWGCGLSVGTSQAGKNPGLIAQGKKMSLLGE